MEIFNLGMAPDSITMVAAITSPDPKKTLKTASTRPIDTKKLGLD
jgi:hypothetical protein